MPSSVVGAFGVMIDCKPSGSAAIESKSPCTARSQTGHTAARGASNPTASSPILIVSFISRHARSARSAQFLDPSDERFRPARHVAERAKSLATRIQEDNGGKPFDPKLLSQLFVRRFLFQGLHFDARKIDLHKHEILLCILGKF